ncbi:MAG: hypothetical protein LBF16_05420 [Pseudomonadales bacterium]|jgi:hypothetical protein|nr:hypothetical protein [Pseudomonadales bacterium]
MNAFFIWLESSSLSLWVRGESGADMAFPVIISLHAIGMGFLAGIASMINLRILGVAPKVPLGCLAAFLPVAWLALAINVVSGVLLLVGYPTKALTNWVFYVKLLCLAGALWGFLHLRRQVLLAPTPLSAARLVAYQRVAALATLLWVAAIVAGRLLAYTYIHLMS